MLMLDNYVRADNLNTHFLYSCSNPHEPQHIVTFFLPRAPPKRPTGPKSKPPTAALPTLKPFALFINILPFKDFATHRAFSRY